MTDPFPGDATCPDRPQTVHITSAEVDETRALLSRFYHPLSIGVPTGADRFTFALDLARLGPLTVGRLRFGGMVTLHAAELDGYHVTLPTDGWVLARHDGRLVQATPRRAAVFRPGSPVHTLHDRRSTELDVKIETAALEAELSAMLGREIGGRIDLAPTMDLSGGPALSWSRLVHLLRRELAEPDSLLGRPLIARQFRQSVLSGLLLTLPHRHHEELIAPVPPGPSRAVRRAVDAINAEPERAFSVGDLALAAGLSVRSLQEGFRRDLDMSPMAYLQQVRLGRVHEELLRGDPARGTVAASAHRWGFSHLGRFASAYRKRFGVAPSQTLRRSA